MASALMMIVFLGIIAALILRLSFGRHIMVSRANASENMRQLGLAVQSQAAACLEGTNFGGGACDLGAAAACMPASIEDGRG
ncbi:MAG: hypothetical protein PHF00_06930, partial [Elusimicrobia bacterium]|nr:hypothetical protein [Elusimicrobiota bacterium]